MKPPLFAVCFRADPSSDLPVPAETRLRFDPQGYIAGGSIAYRSMTEARRIVVVAHELGHAFGLRNCSSASALMSGPIAPATTGSLYFGVVDFTAKERLVMKLMLLRRPGNRFPDRDP